MTTTHIEWTDVVWNPTTGCDRVSAGCDNCYALTMAKRLKGMEAARIAKGTLALADAKYQTDGDPRTSGPGFGPAMHPDTLELPFTWLKPRKVFVNSMSDLFHPKFTDDFIAQVFAVMAATPEHTYQILTKRPARMRALLSSREHATRVSQHLAKRWNVKYVALLRGPLPNVWLGVSVESQEQADRRIPHLIDTPAVVRWISAEPLLGPVDLSKWAAPVCGCGVPPDGAPWANGCSAECMVSVSALDWVVVGGESGHRARPMHPEWARGLRDQCVAAGVPFLFKQWGEWGPAPWVVRVCDPSVGWQGTDDELVAAKADAEARGATHVYASWAHEYGHDLYQPVAKPWSVERAEPIDRHQAPMRRWGKTAAGRELDGRTWDEYPAVIR